MARVKEDIENTHITDNGGTAQSGLKNKGNTIFFLDIALWYDYAGRSMGLL
jgi:hypothetical protein